MKMIIAITAFITIAAALSACTSSVPNLPMNTTTGAVVKTGLAYFGITDAAANGVSSVVLNVTSLEVKEHGGAWERIDLNDTSFDLLQLNSSGRFALMAQANLSPGTYDQVRMDIGSVTITDDNGTHEAKLPSNELVLNTQLLVHEKESSSAEFDFNVNDSLHKTGNGEYILAPVVRTRTRAHVEARVQHEHGNASLDVSGGQETDHRTEGMDLNGTMREGVQVRADANVSIENDHIVEHAGSVAAVLGSENGHGSADHGSGDAGAAASVGVNGQAGVKVAGQGDVGVSS